jgi:glycolate oxidase iron-sulfur subunit
MDEFRSTAGKGIPSVAGRGLSALSGMVLTNKRLSGFAAIAARTVQSTAIVPALLGRIPAARRLQSFLQDIGPRHSRDAFYPTRYPRNGCVGLFTGCTGEMFDAMTIDATIRILDRLGFDVRIDPGQNCCGALALHAGDADRAAELAAQNVRGFDPSDIDAIVTIATGCGAMLKEYPDYFQGSEHFSSKVIDVCKFVFQSDQFTTISFEPLEADILLHTPCSLANVLKTAGAPQQLVEAIPGTRISTLNDSIRCCGAAGNYMLEHPQMADALRQDIIDVIAATKPDYLLTTNVGCALHLRAGLRQQELQTEVIHPIVLLDRQIRRTEPL